MSVVLCTIALNEMEFLPKLWQQHKDWPEMVHWVFVESADRVYANCNPELVTSQGLSTDGTSEFLRGLAVNNRNVTYIPLGFCEDVDPAKGKKAARQRCLDSASHWEPEVFIHLDADEFYTFADQAKLLQVMRALPEYDSFVFPKREIWHPPSLACTRFDDGTKLSTTLFAFEAVGGFWGIPCCHWWRWRPGLTHNDCHNTPTRADGKPLNVLGVDVRDLKERFPDPPQMIHMGYAASAVTRRAKVRYYEERGEKDDENRKWYVQSRSAWRRWTPGTKLPHKAEVVEYQGPVPECFNDL